MSTRQRLILTYLAIITIIGCGGSASSTLVGNPTTIETVKAFAEITNTCENSDSLITVAQTEDDLYMLGGFSYDNGFYYGSETEEIASFTPASDVTCNASLTETSLNGTCIVDDTTCSFEYSIEDSIDGCLESVYLGEGRYNIVQGFTGGLETDTYIEVARDVVPADADYFAGLLNIVLLGQAACLSGSFDTTNFGPTVTTTYNNCSTTNVTNFSGIAYMQFLCDAVYIKIVPEDGVETTIMFKKSTDGDSQQCSSWTLNADGSATCND